MHIGADRELNQPVPLRVFEGFFFWGTQYMYWLLGQGKKQPVPWHGGTG